jgi:transcriptional regulator with XRE-family HTH domain
MDPKERFAQNLTEQREKRGVSIELLARRTSLSVDQIRSLERGEEQPDYTTLSKLADSLGVPVQVFFAGVEWDPIDGFRDPGAE